MAVTLGALTLDVESWSISVRNKIQGADTPNEGHSKFSVGERNRQITLRGYHVETLAALNTALVELESNTNRTLIISDGTNSVFFTGGEDNSIKVAVESYDYVQVRGDDPHYIFNSIRLVQAE